MTNAGWYPDPAGQPQTYRYWDGSSWSAQTTSNPYDPPPGAQPAPPPPPGPATPYTGGTTPPPPPPGPPAQTGGYAGGSPPSYPPSYPPAGPGGPGGSGGSGSSRWVLLAVVGVVLLALIGVGGFFGVRALTDDDTDAADETSQTVTDPSDDATASDGTDGTEGTQGTDGTSETPESTEGITPNTLHCSGGDPTAAGDAPADGQLHGGGLTVPTPKGYTPEANIAAAFVFADAVQASIRQIEELWVSLYAVGGLRRDNGFDGPAQAAELLVQCMTGSDDFYRGFTGREDVRNGPVTIDGHSGHEIYTEVRIEDPDIQAEGDLLHVVVVDTGDEAQYGLYISMAPIGDQELLDRQEQTAQQITVD